MGSLFGFREEQFVWNQRHGSLEHVVQTFPAFLDLYSGARGIPKVMADGAPCWILCFDNENDPGQDFGMPKFRASFCCLLKTGFSRGLV